MRSGLLSIAALAGVILAGALFLSTSTLGGADSPGPQKSGDAAKDEKGGDASKSAAGGASSAEVELVKAGLKDLVHGTVSFAADGTVTIEYDFGEKKEDHQNDFQPPIVNKPQGTFRWTIYQEERLINGETGIRISDRGAAFLNVWFVDDVEAEMEYHQGVSWAKRQICAVVFQAKNGAAVGNNFGGQCATFAAGNLRGGTPPNSESLSSEQRARIGFRMKAGNIDALREGKVRTSSTYSAKTFSSGRPGFIWGGSIAGTLTKFTVKGKLDYATMAKEIKKRQGKK